MEISKWVLLFLVVSITAGISGVANRSSFAYVAKGGVDVSSFCVAIWLVGLRQSLASVSADVAGALFDALLIVFVVLLVLGFTVYRPGVTF